MMTTALFQRVQPVIRAPMKRRHIAVAFFFFCSCIAIPWLAACGLGGGHTSHHPRSAVTCSGADGVAPLHHDWSVLLYPLPAAECLAESVRALRMNTSAAGIGHSTPTVRDKRQTARRDAPLSYKPARHREQQKLLAARFHYTQCNT